MSDEHSCLEQLLSANRTAGEVTSDWWLVTENR